MAEIRVNGVSVYYEAHGTGEPIVCIHGTLSSASFWHDAAAELATRGRAIVYTANGRAIVADERSGYLDVSAAELGTIIQPTFIIAAKDSPPEFAEVTNLVANAMPSARVEWVEGGHLIDPAHPAVLGFVEEVLRTAVATGRR